MFGIPKVKAVAAAAMAAVLVLASGACGSGEDRSGNAGAPASSSDGHAHGDAEHEFDEGEEDSTVALTLTDFRFDGVPMGTKGENVLFEARVSQGEHELDVLGADGKSLGAIAPFTPGDGTKELALKLEPGTYTLQCLVDEGARTHKELGMVATLTVT